VLTRGQGGFPAVAVTLVTFGLVIGDLTDSGFRRWWLDRALTTDMVAGLLVLLVTVLVVDQLVSRRQVSGRSRAVAAQAAIVMGQAARSSRAVSSALDSSGDHHFERPARRRGGATPGSIGPAASATQSRGANRRWRRRVPVILAAGERRNLSMATATLLEAGTRNTAGGGHAADGRCLRLGRQ
jgi:hypothetical protein